jgi:hypothetical protein
MILTWKTEAERTRQLAAWNRAVCSTFSQHSRCLCLALALTHLFNFKTGYAFASNPVLAKEANLDTRRVRRAMAKLEAAGFVSRLPVMWKGQLWRVFYPAIPAVPATLAIGESPVDNPERGATVALHNKKKERRL